jgi:hypothetical protein
MRLDLDRELAEAVQRHQVRQRARAVRGRPIQRGDRRRVDGVVEMCVSDEDAGDAPRCTSIGVEHRRVWQRLASQQQRAQRDP